MPSEPQVNRREHGATYEPSLDLIEHRILDCTSTLSDNLGRTAQTYAWRVEGFVAVHSP